MNRFWTIPCASKRPSVQASTRPDPLRRVRRAPAARLHLDVARLRRGGGPRGRRCRRRAQGAQGPDRRERLRGPGEQHAADRDARHGGRRGGARLPDVAGEEGEGEEDRGPGAEELGWVRREGWGGEGGTVGVPEEPDCWRGEDGGGVHPGCCGELLEVLRGVRPCRCMWTGWSYRDPCSCPTDRLDFGHVRRQDESHA